MSKCSFHTCPLRSRNYFNVSISALFALILSVKKTIIVCEKNTNIFTVCRTNNFFICFLEVIFSYVVTQKYNITFGFLNGHIFHSFHYTDAQRKLPMTGFKPRVSEVTDRSVIVCHNDCCWSINNWVPSDKSWFCTFCCQSG